MGEQRIPWKEGKLKMGVGGQGHPPGSRCRGPPGLGGAGSAEGALGSAVTPALPTRFVSTWWGSHATWWPVGRLQGRSWEDSPSPSQCPGSHLAQPPCRPWGCHTLFTPASAGGRVGRKWELGCPGPSPQFWEPLRLLAMSLAWSLAALPCRPRVGVKTTALTRPPALGSPV